MFNISDKVICIDDNFSHKSYRAEYYNKLPIKDQIYCVREVCVTPVKNLPYIKLVGIWAREVDYGGFITEGGFKPERFRKIEYKSNYNINKISQPSLNIK